MITDVALLVIPIIVVSRLQLNMRTKLALSFVLSLGFG